MIWPTTLYFLIVVCAFAAIAESWQVFMTLLAAFGLGCITTFVFFFIYFNREEA